MKAFKFITLSSIYTVLCLSSFGVSAQTFESGANRFETPIGMNSVQEIDSPTDRVRDEQFNRTMINTPDRFNVSASAIGNLINVVTEGNNNTTIIHADQQNSGSQRITLN